jgi:hypothetical protein
MQGNQISAEPAREPGNVTVVEVLSSALANRFIMIPDQQVSSDINHPTAV